MVERRTIQEPQELQEDETDSDVLLQPVFWRNERSLHESTQLKTRNQEYRESWDILRTAATYGYEAQGVDWISHALTQCNLHSVNENIGKRLRKFDQTPYAGHPRDMMRKAIEMRLHPTLVMACGIHDQREDMELGHLRSPADWASYQETYYRGYPDRERLLRILTAETKTESLEDEFGENKDGVVDFYMNTTLGRRAEQYIKGLRNMPNRSQIPAEDKEHVTQVLYDLNRTFSSSYVEKDGKMEFDASVLIVKILDTWQNLKTTGFWKQQLGKVSKDAQTVTKLIRARVLTNVAEFLGMRSVASDMTRCLMSVYDLNSIDYPRLRDLVTGSDLQFQRKQIRLEEAIDRTTHQDLPSVAKMVGAKAKKGQSKAYGAQVYFVTPWGDQRNGHTTAQEGQSPSYTWNCMEFFAPRSSVPNGQITQYEDPESGFIIDREELGLDQGALRPAIYRAIGRENSMHKIYNQRKWGNAYCRLRLEDIYPPRIISSYRSDSHHPTDQSLSPEINIFHAGCTQYFGPQKDTLGYAPGALMRPLRDGSRLDPRHTALMSFMFSPYDFVHPDQVVNGRSYVIFIGNRMFLASDKTDVDLWTIAHDNGLSQPVVKSSQAGSLPQTVRRGDSNVLNTMKSSGQMGEYNMVFLEEEDI